MRRSTSTNAIRDGFSATPSITSSEPGAMAAATTQNAADDGSPGTVNSNGDGAPAVTCIARSPIRVIGAPSAASMRSVWSRLAAGSTTSVVPVACSPARTRAVLTCALATARWWTHPTRSPPRTTIGGLVPPSRPSRCAPIARNGSITRAMGRSTNDSSPVRTDRKGRPESRPVSKRMLVPEFPQSSTVPGSANASMPRPSTTTAPSSSDVATASWASAARVRPTSSPRARPVTRERPSAIAAKSNARCDIPLSPGTRNRPRTGRGPDRTSSSASCVLMPAGSGRRGSRARAARPRTRRGCARRPPARAHRRGLRASGRSRGRRC